MKLIIVTPEKILFESEKVESMTLPTAAGTITVMKDHEPIISKLAPGEVNIEIDGEETENLVISTGVLQIKRDSEINMLVETAERVEEIDIERAEEAKKKAEEYLASIDAVENEEFAKIEAKIMKELARINAGLKYTRRQPQRQT